MSLEAWQAELRRQFGEQQRYRLRNTGGHAVFSDFLVSNPATRSTYRVAIRGTEPGVNYCACPDFATNHLGICKHIAFALARLERRAGGRAALARPAALPYSSVSLTYGALRRVRFRAGTDCPPALRRSAARFFDREGILRPEAFDTFEAFLTAARRLPHEVRCYEDALAFVAEVRDGRRRAERLAELFPQGVRSRALERLLRAPLYDYQREGALFAARAGRAIIADEMGLGKTVQAFAAAEILARLSSIERVLVICPTSLKHQWEREIERFTGRPVVAVGGLRARRERQFAAPSFYKVAAYDTVHQDVDLIGGWAPDLVVLDEAQRIKNWNTRTARAVKKIVSPYAVVLTGTPLENRLEELVSIVEFVDRHRLGPTYRLLHHHQLRDESGRVVGYRDLDRIGQTLEPILLRRRKADVLDQLPERLEKRLFVPMTAEQLRHHEESREIVARIVARWRRHRFLSEADQRRLMIALQAMRMACDSTYLLDGTTDSGVKAGEVVALLGDLLETPETKVVIFSQWVRMHELLSRRLRARGWEHVVFHGSVPGPQRPALLARFREDPRCRAFLSTDAGGVGLNLQHATAVINVDLPWNPAVLEQRIGRVHRLGQRRPVQVVHLIAQGTIEEGMLSLLGFKRSLFAGVLDGGETEVFLQGGRLQRFMESVEKVTGGIDAAGEEESAARSAPGARREPAAVSEPGRPTAAGPESGAGSSDPFADLLQAGMALVERLASASRPAPEAGDGRSDAGFAMVSDDGTGERYLKLRLPSPEVVQRVADGIRALVQALER